MAPPLRKQRPSVEEELFEKPYEFEFSQAVKLLESLYKHKSPVAVSSRGDLEAVRLKSSILLSAPPSDLYTLLRPENENAQAVLTVNFAGIGGQTGPLPHVYSELILDRIKSKDYAFREFLDLFNNRLNGIHYRIQVKYNLSLNHDRPHETEASKVLKYLGGLNHLEDSESLKISPRSYLKYAGLLWHKPRSAAGLKAILKDYFKLPLSIDQFQGQWTNLEEDQWTIIGKNPQFNVLGEGAALGTRAWIHGEKIRLKIGPLSLENYKAMLPGKELNGLVSEMTRHYLGRENFFEYEIALKSDEASLTKLDGKSALGWTSWMSEEATNYNPESIVIKSDDPLETSSKASFGATKAKL